METEKVDKYQVKNSKDMEEEDEKQCGILCCKPSFLQGFNSIRWFLVWNSLFSFTNGFVMTGVLNITITALETRYNLSSSRSGFIVSATDFGSLPFLVIIGYLGERYHKPKIMSAGIFLMSLSCLVFALPHFIGEEYRYTISGDGSANDTDNVCSIKTSIVSACSSTVEEETSNDEYYPIFIIGQILTGIGNVPMFTLAVTYVDENSKTRDSAFNIGLVLSAAAIGAAVGFIVGGQTLNIFVDIDKVDSSSVPLKQSDPQWVGAWWIGIVAGICLFFLIAFPFLSYPKRLPHFDEIQYEKKSEAHGNATQEMSLEGGIITSIKEIAKGILCVIKNPIFILAVISSTCDTFLIAGLAAFGAKLYQVIYKVSASDSGLIMGLVSAVGSTIGMFLGGWIIKRFDLRMRGILRLCCVCVFLGMFIGPASLLGCDGLPVAGVDQPYINETDTSLASQCNKGCGCTTSGYEPICDHAKVTYFSPCHAGCSRVNTVNGSKVYENCQCTSHNGDRGTIKDGICASTGGCISFYVFLTCNFCMLVLTMISISPIVQAIIRSVPQTQRSTALGIQFIFTRVISYILGPVVFGAILDSSCNVWQDACGAKGNCWIYSEWSLRVKVMIWWICCKLIGGTALFIAYHVYKPPSGSNSNTKGHMEGKDNYSLSTDSGDQDQSNGHFTKL